MPEGRGSKSLVHRCRIKYLHLVGANLKAPEILGSAGPHFISAAKKELGVAFSHIRKSMVVLPEFGPAVNYPKGVRFDLNFRIGRQGELCPVPSRQLPRGKLAPGCRHQPVGFSGKIRDADARPETAKAPLNPLGVPGPAAGAPITGDHQRLALDDFFTVSHSLPHGQRVKKRVLASVRVLAYPSHRSFNFDETSSGVRKHRNTGTLPRVNGGKWNPKALCKTVAGLTKNLGAIRSFEN